MFRRRGPAFSPFLFIFLFFIIDPFFGVTYLFGNILYYILPLVIAGIIGVSVYRIIKKLVSKSKKEKDSKPDIKYSNRDYAKVDDKLKKFFDKNIYLPIVDNISLSCAKGKYTGLNNLYVCFNKEKIIKFSEFENQYPTEYEKILDLLVLYSKKKEDIEVKEEVVRNESVSKAQDFINKINELNDAIPHEEISNGLDQTCQLLKQIDLAVKSEDDKLQKLYEYYLPTLITILNKYRELNDSPVHGEEFNDCENQLMKTILLINQALKTIYNSIHEYEYMDLNADISTLQSILKKDGLLDDNPFEKNNGK